jgi:predicted Zn-dependent protease
MGVDAGTDDGWWPTAAHESEARLMTSQAARNAAGVPAQLVEALAATPGADDWQCRVRRDDEAQLYLIGTRIEALRQVNSAQTQAMLYSDHAPFSSEDSGPMRGSTAVTLSGGELTDPAQLAVRLSDGVAMARLIDNPPFALPSMPASGFPVVRINDEDMTSDLHATVEAIRVELEQAVAAQPDVRLSSAELYATHSSTAFQNSRGLSGAYEGTHVSLDLALLARLGDQEAEFHAMIARRRLADLQIARTIAAYATYARDVVRATPPTAHVGPVILSGDALGQASAPSFGGFPGFFAPIVFQTSGQAAFQKLARCAPGDFITGEEPRGDLLTARADALRPWGNNTAPFDKDGVPATSAPLIEDGVLRRYWTDMRSAAWLGGTAPTGDFAGLSIAAGSWRLEDLRSVADGPVYEIVSFSLMLPDPITGDFVAEIRLGYRHDASGVHPFKGGSLSGNVFTAFQDARLSADIFSDGAYYGPVSIRFGALSIAGE